MTPSGLPSVSSRRAFRQRNAPDVRRQDLLAVTISCLAQLGPKKTTGREICRRAGVSHGLLRHYFRNPQNLLLETYEELCDRFLASFEAALAEPEADPWSAIDRFFAVQFSEEWANPEILGAWQAFWTMVRSDPGFAAKSEQYNARLRELLANAISRLPGPLPVPLDDAVASVSAISDGLWLDMCLSESRTPRQRALELCRTSTRRLLKG